MKGSINVTIVTVTQGGVIQVLSNRGLEEVWNQHFELLFRHLPHMWSFGPAETPPSDCHVFKDMAKVRFSCQVSEFPLSPTPPPPHHHRHLPSPLSPVSGPAPPALPPPGSLIH